MEKGASKRGFYEPEGGVAWQEKCTELLFTRSCGSV